MKVAKGDISLSKFLIFADNLAQYLNIFDEDEQLFTETRGMLSDESKMIQRVMDLYRYHDKKQIEDQRAIHDDVTSVDTMDTSSPDEVTEFEYLATDP